MTPAKKRWPVMVLAAGGVAALIAFRQAAPSERIVTLRLEHPERIRSIELTWIDGDGDPVGSSRFSFATGAPRELTTKVRARDGDYRAQLLVERSGSDALRSERRVAFSEGSTVTLPIE
jgi:hypothetical protein